jgi:hypothetical protein
LFAACAVSGATVAGYLIEMCIGRTWRALKIRSVTDGPDFR